MSVARLIVVTRSSNILLSGKIIKEMLGLVASGTPCIFSLMNLVLRNQENVQIHIQLNIGKE